MSSAVAPRMGRVSRNATSLIDHNIGGGRAPHGACE